MLMSQPPEQTTQKNKIMKENIKKQLPLVVIFGRTNVGKSTLFNCLTEKRHAITSNIEGTTRDSNVGTFEWQGKEVELIDTGGIMDLKYLTGKKKKADDIESKVQQQARDYLSRADLILFLVDSKDGILPQDRDMARILKKKDEISKKVLLVANKADSIKIRADVHEFNKLNLGEPIPVSAATGSGTGDLLDIVIKRIKFKNVKKEIEPPDESIKLCIIGKPNVGKSSLLNALLGYERVIVSDIAHTTREPQDTKLKYKDKEIIIIDTAGISKRGTKTKNLEKFGIEKSLKALKNSDIALLVIDINKEITHQDLKLVEEIVDRRKSFIIIANKWDLIEEKDTKKFTEFIYSKMPFAHYAPLLFVSAKTKSKVHKIFDLALEIAEQRKIKLGDSQLNKFLLSVVKKHRPTKAKGTKHPRIYELKQVQSNPPKFEIRIGAKDTLHYSYLRFIENRLREKYGFLGTPITTYINKNPRIHGKHEN